MPCETTFPPPTLEQLIDLLVRGQRPAVGYSGIVTSVEGGEVRRRMRVWRLGSMVRAEDPPGQTRVLAGEGTYWRAADDFFGEQWERREGDSLPFGDVEEIYLFEPREHWTDWLGREPATVTGSLRPTTAEGRVAWQFSAPSARGGSVSVTVDAELGLVLRLSHDDLGHAITWSEIQSEPSLGNAFFEPNHRKPLVPPAPEPKPSDIERLEEQRAVLTTLLRSAQDWQPISSLIAESDTVEDATAAVARHLEVAPWLAEAVLHAQNRYLTRNHQRALRREIDILDDLLTSSRADQLS